MTSSYLVLKLIKPELKLKQLMCDQIIYAGFISFTADYQKKFEIDERFEVEIGLPRSNSSELPWSKELGGRIPRDFHHLRDTLCLEAPLIVRRIYKSNPTLIGFIKLLLIPFFYSFCYKTQFGVMPDGERSHGKKGILESYKDLLNTNSRKVVLRLLKIIIDNDYDEHKACPCESNNQLKDCHGQIIKEMKDLKSEYNFLVDFNSL